MVTSQTSACLLPCLILGHTVLHCVKITDSLTGLTLCKIDASAWDLIFQLRLRNLHIAGNLVTEAQIFINIGCHDFGCRDSFDNCRRSAGTVSSGVYIRHIFYRTRAGSQNLTSGYRNTCWLQNAPSRYSVR